MIVHNFKQAASIKPLLDARAAFYETPVFIASDPISIPHRFTKRQDIEIAGLFAATLAWGHRSVIIRNAARILAWMDNAPHDFILQHEETDLKRFLHFAHRTFNATDLLYFIHFLKHHYRRHASLEEAFFPDPTHSTKEAQSMERSTEEATDSAAQHADTPTFQHSGIPPLQQALLSFHARFFSLPDAPSRTRKHVATPARGSACKRLCMYLRWMVRPGPVDFGLWTSITPAELICPLDTHVARVAHRLGLLTREKSDWKAALELTSALRTLEPSDPVRYDFALFSLGADERF